MKILGCPPAQYESLLWNPRAWWSLLLGTVVQPNEYMRSNKSKIVEPVKIGVSDLIGSLLACCKCVIVSQSFYIQYMFDGTLLFNLGFLPRKGKEKSLNTTSKRFEFFTKMFDQVWKETCSLFRSLKTNLEPESEPLKKRFLLKTPIFAGSMLIFTGVLGSISHQDWWPGAVGWWSIGNLLGCTSRLQRHRNAYLAFQCSSSWHSDALPRDEFQGNFKNGTHILILLPYCKGILMGMIWE